MIPKKAIFESMKDLRPIALCNVVYKITVKVCANRLKSLPGPALSKAQSAFIPRRLITDNIMLVYEVHHYHGQKRLVCVFK
nr:retrotransposon protein, putative, unclassified [Ipomoea batatas]